MVANINISTHLKGHIPAKYSFLVIILCFLHLTLSAQVFISSISGITPNSSYDTIYSVNKTMQLENSSGNFFNQGFNAEQLTRGLVVNGLKLDSISSYEKDYWKEKKKKYYFKYDNGNLISKECRYFNSSYTDTIGITEYWTYNEQGQPELFQRFKLIKSWNDTTIIETEIRYIYNNGRLAKKEILQLEHIFFSNTNYNGIFKPAGEILYNEYAIDYKYNETGELVEWGKINLEYYPETRRYTRPILYINDPEGRVQFEIFSDYYTFYKYDYSRTDSSKIITQLRLFTDTMPGDFETITNWETNKIFEYILDQHGRDSVLYERAETINGFDTISRSDFQYNTNGKLVFADIKIFVLRVANVDNAHNQIEWVYSDDGRLLEYQQRFFDKRFDNWQTAYKLEYHYSSVKSIEIPLEEDETNTGIYPNPATTSINIGFSKQFTICNLQGHLILSGKSNNGIVDVSGIMPGVYLLKQFDEYNHSIHRFIKK